VAETNPPQTKINVMLPVIVLDRGLNTCFFNWFVFHCKTNCVQCRSSSACLRRGNYIGSGGSCPLLRQLCQYPCCFVVCWRVKDTKLQQSPPCIHSFKMPFSALPAPRHMLLMAATHSGVLAGRTNTWMHIKRSLVGANPFCLYQGFSEMPNQWPEFLRGFEM